MLQLTHDELEVIAEALEDHLDEMADLLKHMESESDREVQQGEIDQVRKVYNRVAAYIGWDHD